MGLDLSNFDVENFGLGVLAGWASGYAVYRSRHVLAAIRNTATRQASSAQTYATRSGEGRYIGDLLKMAQTTHLAGEAIDLSEIVIEPRFIAAPELATPVDDDVVHSVFHVVPKIPDLHHLHAPYNLETLSIAELGGGERALALLGRPGSGRTTALLTIALWSLGRITFKVPRDAVQEQLEVEEAALSDEDRANRIKERLAVEERARLELTEGKGEELDENEQAQARIPVFNRLMPIYVHMANITVNSGEYGGAIDPAEPLVRALQYQVGRVTAKTMPRKLYEQINKGQILLLVDGYDELPDRERLERLAWLEAFLAEYGENFVIVSGPAQGYGALLNTGLAPVFLRPWRDTDATRLVNNWTESWEDIARKRRAKPSEEQMLMAQSDNRTLSPFELTLKTWSVYADGAEGEWVEASGHESWMRAYLARHMPSKTPLEAILPKLMEAATLQLEQGFITHQQLDALALGRPLDPIGGAPEKQVEEQAESFDEEAEYGVDDPFADVEVDEEGVGTEDLFSIVAEARESADMDAQGDPFAGVEADEPQDDDALVAPESAETPTVDTVDIDPDDKKDVARMSKVHQEFLESMEESGLLVQYKGERYQFRHPLLAAYLASLVLAEAGERALVERAFDPVWSPAIGYAAMHTSIEAAVDARMESPADILNNHVFEIGNWMTYADKKVPWRQRYLRKLGHILVAPSQYILTRERAAAALVATRDDGALVVFRKAAENRNPDVRRLACLGIGAMGRADSFGELLVLLEDENSDVQLAAGLALGAIGSDEALEAMVDALTTGEERLRQAVAEAFASLPDEGYPILYDAINHEEMMIRRAAVFGLRRLRTSWALIAIYRAMLEDDQWYVRSAAQQAFQDIQQAEIHGIRGYPPPENIPWLLQWVGEMGEDAPQEASADDLLLLALRDGEQNIRQLSATVMGQLGMLSTFDDLYAMLSAPEAPLRDAAHRALSDLQMQTGYPLPAPS